MTNLRENGFHFCYLEWSCSDTSRGALPSTPGQGAALPGAAHLLYLLPLAQCSPGCTKCEFCGMDLMCQVLAQLDSVMLGSQLCLSCWRRGGSSPSPGMGAMCPCCWLKGLSPTVLRGAQLQPAHLGCVGLLEGICKQNKWYCFGQADLSAALWVVVI